MIQIRIITAFPFNAENQLRKLEDLLPYQDIGVNLSLSHNSIGPLHIQSDVEHALATAGMASAAIEAQKDGVDAIVIESMGDTGLVACRESVNIPVIGLSDVAMRVATMLGYKFGFITANNWHGYALERILKIYDLDTNQYLGFEPLLLQPFFSDVDNKKELHSKMVQAIKKLVEKGADAIVLGGSYFLGKTQILHELLEENQIKDLVIIDPLPLAIRFARLLVDSKLLHSKKYYATPKYATRVIGYPNIPIVPII